MSISRRRVSTRIMLPSLVAVLAMMVAVPAAAAAPLLRFPDIHDETVVFTHGEDIWTAPAGGGVTMSNVPRSKLAGSN